MGYLYRPKLKSDANGRPVRESTGVAADTKTAPEGARWFLKGREGAWPPAGRSCRARIGSGTTRSQRIYDSPHGRLAQLAER